MTRTLHKLSAAKVAALIKDNKQGRHGDGGGLYLQISGGSTSWLFRFVRDGRERNVGLGPARDVSLAQAREKAATHRTTLSQDDDPLDARARAKASTVTFRAAAEQFLANYRRGLRNEKHKSQLGSRLEAYVMPQLGKVPVNRITLDHILAVLQPIWHTIPESASRIRGLIEKLLGFSRVKGWRAGDNPAAWRGK